VQVVQVDRVTTHSAKRGVQCPVESGCPEASWVWSKLAG
jgi:hypothetical protein